MRHAAAQVVTLAILVSAAACTGDAPKEATPTPVEPSTVGGQVDVGGYRIPYECRGQGSPTIVTEAGYGAAGTSTWFPLMDDLAAISRVCSYDRAGNGSADGRPDAEGLTTADQADELHALLEGAGIEPPYVLVAHSYGGFVARLFADTYADETAGLVLIESSHEDEIQAYRHVFGRDSPDADWIDGGDLLDIDATEEALREARDYGSLPLVVIQADIYEDVLSEALWRRTQADLATLSSDSMHIVADGAGHDVLQDAPAVVLASVRVAVEAARSGEPLPSCEVIAGNVAARCA